MKQQSLLGQLHKEVKKFSDKKRAEFVAGYFKTGKGQYGEGDVFVGLTVPQARKIANEYKDLLLNDIQKLLKSLIHEERLVTLLILVAKFQKAEAKEQKVLVDFYLANTKYINNWDLVDLSADKIVGEYLYSSSEEHSDESRSSNRAIKQLKHRNNVISRSKATRDLSGISHFVRNDNAIGLLQKLANSDSLWERRIAMISTYAFIKHGKSDEAITIATLLVHDKNDLIQKAVGWMLREVGKRVSKEDLREFLAKHKSDMGRTALRYAIEHFPEKKRKAYLAK